MKKVVLSHSLIEEGMKLLMENFDVVKVVNSGETRDLLSEMKDAHGVIIRVGSVTKEMLNQCKNLKVIGRPGVGVDSIDVKAATELGIPVVVTPGVNGRSVAEHTVGLMFDLYKGISKADAEIRKGNFGFRYTNKSFELLGKKIFVIGFGNIGKEVSKICKSIGMQVTVYDPFVEKEVIETIGYQYSKTIAKTLPESDVITIHVPLTSETTDLFHEKQFNIMKKEAIIINCSRGGIINEEALLKALEEEKIMGAASDVFVKEPIDENYSLLKAKNLIATPHNASLTREATLGMALNCVNGVIAVVNKNKWTDVVNKEAYNHLNWEVKKEF